MFVLVIHHFMGLRWPLAGTQAVDQRLIFAVNVFVGLAIFNFFAEVLVRSPTVVLGNPNLVSRIRFPLAILPASNVGVAAIHAAIPVFMVTAISLWLHGLTPAHAGLPLLLAILTAYAMGAALGLAALGVYVRDVAHVMPAIVSFLMFLSPVFYPVPSESLALRAMFDVNPIAWGIEGLRQLLWHAEIANPRIWVAHTLGSATVLILGGMLFRKLARGFADVL
jgi:lipopolysaccharide transport system permease protein